MSDQASLGNVNLGQPAAQPGETGYVPPTEVVPLPSKGKIYPPENPLHLAETVEIRSMTARDEDILTSRALLKQGKAIGTLLRSCMTNKSIDSEQMVVGDRNAVLIAVRITGYGSDYEISVECPKCDEKAKHSFDLAQLPIKPLGADPVEAGQNVFAFELPVSKKAVLFKLLSGADERDLGTQLERARKVAGVGGMETPITTRLQYQVLSLGGEKDKGKLAGIIKNLPARDAKSLRNYIDEISPGVKMSQLFTCGQCGEESEVDVPMGTEFFWPSA